MDGPPPISASCLFHNIQDTGVCLDMEDTLLIPAYTEIPKEIHRSVFDLQLTITSINDQGWPRHSC